LRSKVVKVSIEVRKIRRNFLREVNAPPTATSGSFRALDAVNSKLRLRRTQREAMVLYTISRQRKVTKESPSPNLRL
jgi:hypothetical protein